jgi:hypothetical protein
MIGDANVFNPPPDDAKIWRYMDFSKYVSFLDTQALYFARVDRLEDQFEGTYSRANLRMRPEEYKDLYETNREGFDRMFQQVGDVFRWLKKWTFVNCWHQNDFESAAMWRLYARTNDAIAIQTTYSRLRRQLPADVYIGMVEYMDYDSEWLPEGHTLFPFVHKRKSFEHERELRAISQPLPNARVALDTDQWDTEKYQTVALPELVERVCVAPTAPAWFRRTVESVTRRYGFASIYVSQSSLDDAPVY